MIKVEKIDVWGFKHAIRGMRNPMNSWDKSDSYEWFIDEDDFNEAKVLGEIGKDCVYQIDMGGSYLITPFIVGKNDLDLMRRLYNAGSEHRKYLRQIFVSMDITAPLYWWKEFDTYKFILPDPSHVDINSCSTMHKIHAKEFELDDFSHERLTVKSEKCLLNIIDNLNVYRNEYLERKEKDMWWQMIQSLPSSYNQKRTVVMNYENVVAMIRQRTGHKLDEWNDFVALLHGLPYVAEIIDE